MDDASAAPKPVGADDEAWDAVETAGAATAGMRIASICIAVPRDRLHSMRQPEENLTWTGFAAAMAEISTAYMK